MFASRWHSPPKPPSVLSCTTGMCRWASRSASRLPCTSPSSTPARTPSRPWWPSARSSSVVLPAPGALIRFTTVTPWRSKSSRLARAIVLLASSASSTTLTFTRCTVPPRRSIRLRVRSPQTTVDVGAPRTTGQRNAGTSTAHSARSRRSAAAPRSAPARAGALADRVARDDPPVEVQRVRHDLAQRADAQLDGRHLPPGGVPDDGVDDRGADRELMHRPRPCAARRSSRARASAPGATAASTTGVRP